MVAVRARVDSDRGGDGAQVSQSEPGTTNANDVTAPVGEAPPSHQPQDEAWYAELVDILMALSAGAPSPDSQPNHNLPDHGGTSGERSTEEPASAVAWMTAAKALLDDLVARIGPASAQGQQEQDQQEQGQQEQKPGDSDPVDWLTSQALVRIAELQASLGRQLNDARASLEDAVQNMLPPQLRQPWVAECAQLCLDRETHPGLSKAATIRIGHAISDSEAAFQATRAEAIRSDFAEFIGVPAASIDPRDIPIIGVAGSGGGFRAMVATLGSYRTMREAGLAQCVMYDAAVSGSSWAVAALHTYGRGSPYVVLDSVRLALTTSMFSAAGLAEFVNQRNAMAKRVFSEIASRTLMQLARSRGGPPNSGAEPATPGTGDGGADGPPAGAVAQAWGGLAQLGGWALDTVLPSASTAECNDPGAPALSLATVNDLLHASNTTLRSLAMPPLSIVELYGALLFRKLLVQHGRGAEDGGPPELDLGPQWVRLSAQRALVDQGRLPMPIYTAVRHFLGTNDNDPAQAQSRRYEWFELSPYEVGSIDHGAWVASWAFGRPMAGGREQLRIGEAHFGSILGAVSSAFCASAKAMVMELYLAAPAVVRATMDVLLDRIEDGAEASHPIAPYTVHNPFHGAGGSELGELAQTPFLSLMDAGLENNLPFAPLLRPERGVDVIVCLDASANIELMPWFARAEAWAASHGATRWPWGARPWAADPLRPSRAEAELDRGMLGGARSVREHTARQLKEGNVRCAVFDQPIAPSPLGHAGSVSEPPVTVVYLPLLPNEHFREPAFDPERAAFCATFNDRWTGEQVDRLADLASHNLGQEMERVREAVATAYRRKRAHRLCREQAASHGSTGFS